MKKRKYSRFLQVSLYVITAVSCILSVMLSSGITAEANEIKYRMPLNNGTARWWLGDWRTVDRSTGASVRADSGRGHVGFHAAEDITSSDHTVFAAADGEIVIVNNMGQRGWQIIISHNDFWAEYLHIFPNSDIRSASKNASNVLHTPIPVTVGQQIGVLATRNNTTNFSFAVHLHFSIRAPLSTWNTSERWYRGSNDGTYPADRVASEGFVKPSAFFGGTPSNG